MHRIVIGVDVADDTSTIQVIQANMSKYSHIHISFNLCHLRTAHQAA